MDIQSLILDFDGVLVESVDIKTEAFRKLFSFAPAHVEEIVRYHKENAGVSRFEKFRHIYAGILHEDLSDARFRELSDRFSSLVTDAVVNAPAVPGSKEFLQRYYQKIPLFVVSATPENELGEIIRRRKMEPFFRGIRGSPVKKEDNIAALVDKERLDPEKTVYVGDALNDLDAARKAGLRFIGRIRPGLQDPFGGHAGVEATVRDLAGLSAYVEEQRC